MTTEDIPQLQAYIERLERELELYECYRGDIQYAMHKVGHNNDRIADAEESLDEGLSKLNGGDV